MIEGFETNALVIINLVNPKEKFFGILRALSAAGVTLRGINLDSFDDWIHQIAREEEQDIDMITMFVPLFRVERIFLDEPSGAVKSYSQRFADVTGQTVGEYVVMEGRGPRAEG
ncbi:MAG TPA: hypothetical protein VF701_18175 [Thermoanaerobaculia bacterium]